MARSRARFFDVKRLYNSLLECVSSYDYVTSNSYAYYKNAVFVLQNITRNYTQINEIELNNNYKIYDVKQLDNKFNVLTSDFAMQGRYCEYGRRNWTKLLKMDYSELIEEGNKLKGKPLY